MRRVSRKIWSECDRVASMIELLITCHPKGFNILLGKATPPESIEIHEMMNSQRVEMPSDFKPSTPSNETEAERIVYDSEYFEKTVLLAGGWKHINEVVQEFKKANSRVWAIVIDHEKFVTNAAARYQSKLEFVARRYGISKNTVLRYRRNFSQKIAYMCLLPPCEGENFYLIPYPDFRDF